MKHCISRFMKLRIKSIFMWIEKHHFLNNFYFQKVLKENVFCEILGEEDISFEGDLGVDYTKFRGDLIPNKHFEKSSF